MADLDNLIKVRKHQVDEKRKVLANLFKEADRIENIIKQIKLGLERERKLAEEMKDPQVNFDFMNYAALTKDRIDLMTLALEKTQARVVFGQEDVRNAFADLKKIEITNRERLKKERKERDKKESDELDEIAITRFGKNLDDAE